MATFPFKVGDTKPILATLERKNAAGDFEAIDLTGASVRFLMRYRPTPADIRGGMAAVPTILVDAAATIDDADAGEVRYPFTDADAAEIKAKFVEVIAAGGGKLKPVHFEGEWRVTIGDVIETIPADSYIDCVGYDDVAA